MAFERRGLLILFEGFPPTVIRSQVIVLAGWLAREGIIRLDILSVACTARVFEQSHGELPSVRDLVQRENPHARVTLLRGMRPAVPGSTAWNRRLVDRYLASCCGDYAVVHARTDYAAYVVAPLARRRAMRLVWDCRGDAVAELLARRTANGRRPGLLLRGRAASLATHSRQAATACQAAIFVTRALQDRYGHWVRGPSCVIPTLADGSRFYFDPELRLRMRAKLGFGENQPVFVFSGTLASYQGFQEAIRIFKSVAAQECGARLLVLTPAIEEARAQLTGVDGDLWTVRRVDFDAMNGMLNAADYAFLIRPQSAINVSAFPTKFAEYGLAGLQVVMGDATPDCLEHAMRADNRVLPERLAPKPQTTHERRRVSLYYYEHLTQASFAADYREIYG